ncbi:MAG: NADH-quinone oxidoreductase subunit C, partial [Candidatus Neomarinimicrobiota bacterium]|nr:NADH-quinone oxidoreductase subunit C [Candidatus Neomarinimicrobiota bacterium]
MPTATILSKIKERLPDAVLDITEFAGEHILHVQGQDILTVLTELKDDGFHFLADLTAIDNLTLGGFDRFAVSYHLLSHKTAERVTVKAYISEEKPSLPSVESLWKTADWQEREVFD